MKKNLLFLIFLLLFTINIFAVEPLIWSINSREDVAKGDSRGVSINDNGSITLSQKLNEVFKTEQPFVWSSAVDNSGNFYLGTGSDGKIFKVDSNGKGTLFYDATELNVSALAVGNDGSIFAGTSPDGKVYRISANGSASVYFEPKEKYIWSLAVLNDGSLAVGTGETGKIFKVRSANANPSNSILYDTSETHIISLATDKNSNLYAGTDAEGLVLRFSSDGKPFALLDSTLREIHQLAVGIDGSVYVLALSESASTAEKKEDDKKAENKTVSIEKKNPNTPPKEEKSRYDLSTAKSAVYRILPNGGYDILWKSDEITAFSIYSHLTGNGVLIGTSDKGRIYNIRNDGQSSLVLQTDEEQVSDIKTFGNRLFATTSNQGKFFRFGGETNSEGTYESPVLDAKASATWGNIWWRANGNVEIQTRSGNSAFPNETWSAWNSVQNNSKINSPNAQFLQWRAILKSSNTEAILNEVNVAFLPRNIAPEVLSIEILPTNVGLAGNPEMQNDPNIDALGLDPTDFGIVVPPNVPRKLFQIGAKSFQWKAEDRNEDNLVYSIFYRKVSETNFKLLRENLNDSFFTIDGLSFEDGRYVIKIIASDSPSNSDQTSLAGEKVSEPFDIDNSAPNITASGNPTINGENVRVIFDASESSSFIKRAEYNINGGKWNAVFADDGISDSQKERYTLNLKLKDAGEYTITLRVIDANGNAGSARVLVRK